MSWNSIKVDMNHMNFFMSKRTKLYHVLGGDLAGAIEKQSKIGEPFSVDRVENWTGNRCAEKVVLFLIQS